MKYGIGDSARLVTPYRGYSWVTVIGYEGDGYCVELTSGLEILERFLSRDEARMSGCGQLYRWSEEGQRVIKISWSCPHCAHTHEDFIPESFIRQKKAIFVEITESEGEAA